MTINATDAPPVERQLATDMIRRGLPLAPAVVILAGLAWGVDGALSALYGLGLVTGNLALAAVLLSWAGRKSVTLLMATALFGYLVRLGLITAAVLLVKDQSWVDLVALGLTIIVTHLALLFWETSRVSASLAFPGLRPEAGMPEQKGA